ncbi:MAG: shikimate dehydrogenase, partial [candidate division Zixibacteria bacterium]|nr:shikimate dehydrogenase [candidate division Zixibacteria bacterium]
MKSHLSPSSAFESGIYGLVGCDIPYSLSPVIFRRVFDNLGWRAVYGLFDLDAPQLPRFLRAAGDCGIRGFNVTQPYKIRIMPLLDRIDPASKAIGAVNTVVREGRRWTGHNTDAHGIQSVLSTYSKILAGSNAVIIGTGGAARAVAYVLAMKLRVSQVTFAVRSAGKGRSLVRRFAALRGQRCSWSCCPLTRVALDEYLSDAGLLVNATPVGGHGFVGRSPLPHGVTIPLSAVVFDLVYRPAQTRLLRDARAAGCKRLIGGWGML